MAETFLSPVIEILAELLAEGVLKALKGVHNEVKSLQDELEIIQPFLRDAEAKLEKGEVSDAAKVWLKQLRDKANRIEDVVDECFHHVEKHRRKQKFISSLQKASDCIKTLKPSCDIASKIRNIKASLREIKIRGQSYGLTSFEQRSSYVATSIDANIDAPVDPRLGSLFIGEDEFVEADSTLKELTRSLIEVPSTRMVISLVGEGGIGKTTLAKKVYNDEILKENFDCYAWITVSQSYKVANVLNIMKSQIIPTEEQPRREIGAISEVIDLLRSYLQSKRYVIVFDDVWQLDFWDIIQHALPSNERGSRIIITTRNNLIAYRIKKTPCDLVQKLKPWSPQLAWELFCKKAFAFDFEGRCPQQLQHLSREIIEKCQGLPLVITAVAGLLSTKEKIELEWQRVLDNLNYEFEENPQLSSVSKILSFSYHDLPNHLKHCFLYFAIFPEDYSIFEKRLVRLWVAEGFIKSKRGKTLEEVAEEYLSELIHRNLVSFDIKFGHLKWCRVHDLIHEIILKKAEELEFCQIFKENKLRFKGKSHRLSIHGSTKDVLKSVGDSNIRSIFLFDIEELTESFLIRLFKKFKLLKVLDFKYAPLDILPKEVGNLYNLKYLNLEGTKVKMLPKCIGKLHNLQTIDIWKTSVQELPIQIKKLENLRHLIAYPITNTETEFHCSLIQGVRIQEGIGSLKELQTLLTVEAYPSGVSFVEELERLSKLKVLSLVKLTAETGKALEASIEKMNKLEQLYLTSINEDELIDLKCISSPPPLLQFLELKCHLQQLPDWFSKLQNLQGLNLSFSRLIEEPLKCLKGLPNLAYLDMYQAYDGEILHFEFCGFQKLKQLKLRKLEGLKVVKIDSGALPLLEELHFGPSSLIMEMPSDIQHLTNLKALKVIDMAREFVINLQPHGGPHHWTIQHVPSVQFWFKDKGQTYDVYKLGEPDLLSFCEGRRVKGATEHLF